MKVAIIGAGISGLSCAIELEKHNITPVIYEKNDKIGDLLGYPLIWPGTSCRTHMDPVKYLKSKYDLSLKPLNQIRKVFMYSSDKESVRSEKLGYIFKKGIESYSLENQLASRLGAQILFNRYIDIDDIKNEYDHIIVATGSNIIAKKLGVWAETLGAVSRVANGVGSFKNDSITMWLDQEYCKNGLCYAIPINEKQATIVMIVNGISVHETDYYWKQFLIHENINCTVTETMDAEHVFGLAKPLQKGNVLFAGNAGGFTADFVGCGSFNAVESGILAARAIIYGENYNSLAAPIYTHIGRIYEIREAYIAGIPSKISLK